MFKRIEKVMCNGLCKQNLPYCTESLETFMSDTP